MIRCPGWDATSLPFRLATVHDTLLAFGLRLGSGPLPEAAMASSSLRTGLAITSSPKTCPQSRNGLVEVRTTLSRS